MKRKGISPLIAAVLLIAFTMAVAAMLTAWVTTFTQERTETVSNKSGQVVQCSYAGVSIFDAVYHSGDNTTDVTVANTGTYDFKNVTVHVFREGGGVVDSDYTGNLDTAEVVTLTLDTELTSAPGEVRAISEECPEKTDQLMGSEITTTS